MEILLLYMAIHRKIKTQSDGDEGKRAVVFHGFLQGDHGKQVHCKINFLHVWEHTEPKVN